MPTAEKKYIESVGRRKTSTARVRLEKNSKKEVFEVNGKKLSEYFPTLELQAIAKEAFKVANMEGAFATTAKIVGGGIHSQAEALRLGIAKALETFDKDFRKPLKVEGLLARDPRAKERRKFGLKKARKAPQWSKR